jgi:hypothetical protein
MKFASLPVFAIAALAGIPPGASAMPNLGPPNLAMAASAAPSLMMPVRHRHHHRHHWRHQAWRGEPSKEAAPDAAGSSAMPQTAAPQPSPPPAAAPSSRSEKPTIQWVDPNRPGR